jgi:hypothetical protein
MQASSTKTPFITRLIVLSGVLVTLGLAGCGTDNTPPYVKKLNHNVRSVSEADTLTVFAEHDYPAPASGQTTTQLVYFKTVYNLYKNKGYHKVLIPSNTIVSGVYNNDGKGCTITWKDVYAHGDQTMDNHNAVNFSSVTVPTICNPTVGLKEGEPLIINFNTLH